MSQLIPPLPPSPPEAPVDLAHRKRFGQFFTPPDVARFMVNWTLGSGQCELYDPAFGMGAFYRPVRERSDVDFSASEIDPTILQRWRTTHGGSGPPIEIEDYLSRWGRKRANIVCNPPYMRFQKFADRDRIFAEFERNLGVRVSGYTNTASAFLLKSLSEMDGTGRLAYIMPLEFLNAGYGALVKRELLKGGRLTAILSVNCEKEVFPDATTSIGILLYDAANSVSTVKFYNLDSVGALDAFADANPTSEVKLDELQPESKWLPYFQANPIEIRRDRLVRLDEYGRFSRGIATGANEFFVMKPSVAASRGLEPNDCVRCVTRSAQVKKALFVDADLTRLEEEDAPVWLFSPNGNRSKRSEAYIRYGEERGFDQRFLTKHRNPWHKTERRSPSPLWLGVFSRGGYKIIRNRSGALNLTCFHGFQPSPFGRDYLERLFLFMASPTGRNILSLSIRKYGDALDKFEPNDLNGAWVPRPELLDRMEASLVAESVKALEEDGVPPEAAESFFATLALASERAPT